MKKLIILLLIIFFVSGCSKNQEEITKQSYVELPQSFSISFYLDGTSGGGNREYTASLTFVDNKIKSGSSNYKFYGTDGLKKDITCSIDIEKYLWFEEETNNICKSYYYLDLPYTKNELQNLINSAPDFYKNLPRNQCQHGAVCYQIF